jgi:protein O-mannosyl-transferase
MAHSKRRKPRLPVDAPHSASVGKPPGLRTISPREFAGRFAASVREQQQSFTWFLGAGCSKSSGILDAGGLVEKWLVELHKLQAAPGESYETWLKRAFGTYDPNSPAKLYAEAFEQRYPSAVERQREIEMICALGEPAYGYATFAQILSHKDCGRFCNTVLTTNFDDLIADALYLYGERHARPLVVTHEALARYVRTNSPRPTVIKLHGDAHLNPKNLRPETLEIDASLSKQLYPFLQDHALVFIGYGGNDQSILKFVKDCPVPPLAPPIFWISKREAPELFADWLSERGALRVDHTDFDQLMHFIRGALAIELLDKRRWDRIGAAYYQAFEQLKEEIAKLTTVSANDSEALNVATVAAQKSLPDDWSFYSHAHELEEADPDAAERYYQDGLKRFPDSMVLNGGYGVFLHMVRNNAEAAEVHYKRALEIDPNEIAIHGNYATLLRNFRHDMDGAEIHYKRALEINPDDADNLGNYATFLHNVRKDTDAAETCFKRALEIDPNHTNNLGHYANFLRKIREDMEGAEALYRRAIEIDPSDPNKLGNYAQLLLGSGRQAAGLSVLDKAFELAANGHDALKVELPIYRYAHDFARRNEALKLLKDALANGVKTPNWSFAITLERAAKDGHPDIPLLIDLTKVANGEGDMASLDKHAAWRDA